ncbi:MAG: DnaB-like helicase C-terminal domain-containing protein [Desulfatiglandales bacterium]
MDRTEAIREFYLKHLPGAVVNEQEIQAPCPICARRDKGVSGRISVALDPAGLFTGYFRCSNPCTPGGFAARFAGLTGLDPEEAPGYDPEREPFVHDVAFPSKNLNPEIKRFTNLMGEPQFEFFRELGVSGSVLSEMQIGYNGRYLVYPYIQEDGNAYAARCVLPEREEDCFWHGDERFFDSQFRVFNVREIGRCEGGALFVTEGENNLLVLRELGYPGIAVPSYQDLDVLGRDRLAGLRHVIILVQNSPEAQLAARDLATRIGFKARILRWPRETDRGYNLVDLARDKGERLKEAVKAMVRSAESFSPFSSPAREERLFIRHMEQERGKTLLGLPTGFPAMDRSLNGIRGINIMGGQPKAGKSAFFMHVSTEVAARNHPVIYYDFENGRRKIYMRTLCRLARLSEEEIRLDSSKETADREQGGRKRLSELLHYFRVVTDRKLTPDIMRRHIEFLQHETASDHALVVVDSLHKLPFKNLSERRTGIDEWLRHMESIRDEQNVAFLVVSELSRGQGGSYSGKPDLASFKESGDIEYSADNAMILVPHWDPLDPVSTAERKSGLWLVASRENSPGRIAEYVLEYPYWGFREEAI